MLGADRMWTEQWPIDVCVRANTFGGLNTQDLRDCLLLPMHVHVNLAYLTKLKDACGSTDAMALAVLVDPCTQRH